MNGTGSTIADFMIGLSEDPARLASFKYSMEDELEASGLTEEQKDVIRSKDLARIREEIEKESGRAAIVIIWEDFRDG